MRMIPTHCLACSRLALSPDSAIDADGLSACECGAAAHAVPGPTYAASDVPLFDAIAHSLRSAGINWLNAKHLSIGLRACESPRPVIKLQALQRLAPELTVIESVVSSTPAIARSAVAMFETVLEALAHGQAMSLSRSGSTVR